MKQIRLSRHAHENMQHRGATEQEVIEAIETADWGAAQQGRLECVKNFKYGRDWNNKHFETKSVRPIFIEQANEIVVVTVYVYYFSGR